MKKKRREKEKEKEKEKRERGITYCRIDSVHRLVQMLCR